TGLRQVDDRQAPGAEHRRSHTPHPVIVGPTDRDHLAHGADEILVPGSGAAALSGAWSHETCQPAHDQLPVPVRAGSAPRARHGMARPSNVSRSVRSLAKRPCRAARILPSRRSFAPVFARWSASLTRPVTDRGRRRRAKEVTGFGLLMRLAIHLERGTPERL